MIPIPLLASGSNNSLIFNYTALGVLTYDPSVTTSRATIVKFKPDGAPETAIGPSTVHAFSYVPSAGNHSCRITVVGGLGLVTSIDSNTDGLTSIKNIEKCRLLTTFTADANPLLQLNLSSVAAVTYTLSLGDCSLVQGNLSSIAAVTYSLRLYNCPLVQGDLSSVAAVTYNLNLSGCPLVTGFLTASLATAVLSNMSMDQARVDDILLTIKQLVDLDADHFPAAHPSLALATNDATPSGVYQFSANPTTGLELAYYLCHLGTHSWTIIWNGGSGP